jgi:hypothetical protein
MDGKRSAIFLIIVGALAALGLVAGFDAQRRQADAEARLLANRALGRWFGLTDLCLFTDARYTRHPSLADPHSPFQDAPLALEHFPSGALRPPPAHLTRPAGVPPNPDGRPQ